MVVHLFGATSSPSCANLPLRTAAEQARESAGTIVKDSVMRSFYVDDYLRSYNTDDEAISIFSGTVEACDEGGFRLHKIVSNSRQVIKAFDSREWASSVVSLDMENLPTERALGVVWDAETDELTFNIRMDRDKPITRRGILSVVSGVFDPLGLAAPFVLPAKILLQVLCKAKLGWDEDIGKVSQKSFETWKAGIISLERIRIPRCIKPVDVEVVKYELHYFTDAREIGCGVVCYLRCLDKNKNATCRIITSKSKVAPLKKISIPRLELTAASLAVRMNKSILNELEITINQIVFWTDSMSVLRYIANNSARYQTFVANRVNIIREGSQVDQWRYVRTSENPADYASRGINPSKSTVANEFWFRGPDFLNLNVDDWPTDSSDRTLPDDDVEVKRNVIVVNSATLKPIHPIEKLADRFSCWQKFKRSVAWWIQCVRRLRDKVKGTVNSYKRYLTPVMLNEAENRIIQHVQKNSFPKEMITLNHKNPYVTKDSPLYRLDPYIKDGLIRVGGRISRASIPFDEKHQIILPKQVRVSVLIIEDAHRAVGHLGKNSIMAYIRKRFWITHATGKIKSITDKCVSCREYHGKPGKQKMADVPEERLAVDKPPFANTGIDYFGPIEIKSGRSKVERYGVVLTCMTSRAIHLESANSLETDSCVNAIRRFIARRGAVKHIGSDNGSNLVGAQNDLKQALTTLDQEKISKFCAKHDIEWDSNPPLASHFGGIWERMIRTVGKILFHLMRDQSKSLNDEMLNTILCESEMIVNNRPLYDFESNNPNDPKPLTPNHLLLLEPKSDLPIGVFDRKDSYANRRWRQVQYMASVFWKRWSDEYMKLLQIRSTWNRTRKNVAVGDVVLIVDSSIRNSWVRGIVSCVELDSKGLVRAATGKTSASEFRRPVDKLCVLLEVDSS
ncbi:uncharacterized protein LOC141906247 [Tubulanus polymorphus]|uniref:uncharacterized protein LOC141906247 n=1 Tax=Tubulanus polymorphus TaxID=672921 RepID=UPI003DA4BA70